MMRAALERNVVDYQTLCVLWFKGFILSYFVYSIAEALYAILIHAAGNLASFL
jgi:hypothetical protein